MQKDKRTFGLKGTFVYAVSQKKIKIETGVAVCIDGICKGIFKKVPEKYTGIEITDYTGKIIIPGMTDLHIHAPQYQFRTIGMDMELLDWLNTYTFPEEAKYKELDYAKRAYDLFAEDLKESVTTRACIFGTMHEKATEILMDTMEATGLVTMTGLVNMDRNSPDYLCDGSVEASVAKTAAYIEEARKKYDHTMPILTPRFIPSCSDELMTELTNLKKKYKIALQSHLSENLSEIEWVQGLCPKAASYSDAYNQAGSFDQAGKTVMAHCVYLSDDEITLLKKNNVYVAHCPESNMNLASGIAPIRKYLDNEMKVGLGTDVAAGTSANMLQAIVYTVQASKIYWRMADDEKRPLSVEEAFYLASKGGGSFFGKVGSFEEGFEMDAVVLDDSDIQSAKPLTDKERFERLLYLGNNQQVRAKYVAGRKIVL